jgi:uncharacterized protein (TIGR02594 family)
VEISAYDVAKRFIGLKETPGIQSNPLVLGMLQLDGAWPKDDTVPWCSAFVNFVAFLLGLPRSRSLAARSWLTVGREIRLDMALPGFDVVVLQRDGGGHVGFYVRSDSADVWLLGGNQHDQVSIAEFPRERILGIRRLADWDPPHIQLVDDPVA